MIKKFTLLLFILLFVTLLFECEDLPSNPLGKEVVLTNNVIDWRDEVIYQLMTDRFADGDVSNNYNVDLKSPGAYHGGDYQGVIDKIWYLKELGVTAIWISPVVQNVETDAGYWSYHGYWAQDFTKVNKHFGSLAKLKEMVDICHQNGIKVILDIVCNHVGQLFYYDINENGQPDIIISGHGNSSDLTRVTEYDPDFNNDGVQNIIGEPATPRWIYMPEINRIPTMPECFQNFDWYHKKGRSLTYSGMDLLHGDFPGGLKDLATERPDLRQAMIDVYLDWIKKCDFDGFRIDTVKHVEHGFWQVFCPAIRKELKELGKENFFMFGEVFDGNDQEYGSYTKNNELDSLFYFRQKFELDGIYWNSNPTTASLEDIYKHRIPDSNDTPGYTGDWYGVVPHKNGIPLAPYQCMVNFLDNHDVGRFLEGKTENQLRHALNFIFTIDGIPCIYYGTEQNFISKGDPTNRRDLWDSGFDTSNQTFQTIKRLTELRREYKTLRRGNLCVKWSSSTAGNQDEGIFAFERRYEDETLLVVHNFHPTEARMTSAAFGNDMQTTFSVGTQLQSIYSFGEGGDESTVTFDGTGIVDPNNSMVSVLIPPLGCKIYKAVN